MANKIDQKIRLTFLGCGDAFNSGGNGHTCFLLEGAQNKILIDCGQPALQKLKAKGMSTNEIDMIVISHFHGDHIGNLPFLLLDEAKNKRTKPLHIFTPDGGKSLIKSITGGFYPGMEMICDAGNIEWHEYREGKKISVNGVGIQGFKVVHAEKTNPHGIRIAIDDKIIAYSGDTEYTGALKKLADNADLFICECTFFESEMKGHIHYDLLRKKLKELNYKKIVLTHFDEEMLAHKSEVREPMASDGLVVRI